MSAVADSATLPEQLARWCELANLCAQAVNEGELSTCIGTSYALAAFLQGKGLGAAPVRVTASMHAIIVATTPRRRGGMVTDGTVLGSDGGGQRLPKLDRGWWGHAAVEAEGFLLDPTINQVELGGVRPAPLTFRLPDRWPDGECHVWLYTEGAGYQHPAEYQDPGSGQVAGWHRRFRTQRGLKSKPDARRSHWIDVVEHMRNCEHLRTDWEAAMRRRRAV